MVPLWCPCGALNAAKKHSRYSISFSQDFAGSLHVKTIFFELDLVKAFQQKTSSSNWHIYDRGNRAIWAVEIRAPKLIVNVLAIHHCYSAGIRPRVHLPGWHSPCCLKHKNTFLIWLRIRHNFQPGDPQVERTGYFPGTKEGKIDIRVSDTLFPESTKTVSGHVQLLPSFSTWNFKCVASTHGHPSGLTQT